MEPSGAEPSGAEARDAGPSGAEPSGAEPSGAEHSRLPKAGEATVRRASTGWLIGLGVLLGLAALTRNEAIWLGLTWAIVAWVAVGATRHAGGGRRLPEGLRMVGIPALVAVVVFAPWAIRDWLTFGTPLPGQALANALSLQGTDIFAWQDPPTLARYLGAGFGTLAQLRVTGVEHNIVDVLLLLGIPVSAIGLVALPWTARGTALQPLLVFSVITFVVTSLVFPVATTWGTFLHAAGAIAVLLIISALLALDARVEWLRARRAWTRPVAWLGPALAISSGLLFTVAVLPSEGGQARAAQARFAALPGAIVAGGGPDLRSVPGPVITDTPIWFAESTGHTAIALPAESPASILDLARHFGSTLLVVQSNPGGSWPAAPYVAPAATTAATDPSAAAAACFSPVPIPHLLGGSDPLDGVLVYSIGCP